MPPGQKHLIGYQAAPLVPWNRSRMFHKPLLSIVGFEHARHPPVSVAAAQDPRRLLLLFQAVKCVHAASL